MKWIISVLRCGAAAAILALAAASATATVGAAPSEHVDEWSTAVLDLPNGGVAYDHVRDRLLVSVAGTVPTLGNHLVEIDPRTGERGRSVWVGSRPRTIAVSSEAGVAYVGLAGSPEVVQIDLVTFEVVRRIPLGFADGEGPTFASDIEIQPGDPEVIAVVLVNQVSSPSHEGVAVYDAGQARAAVTADHTGPSRIVFGSTPSILYGVGGPNLLYEMTVDGDGVTRTRSSSIPSTEGGEVLFVDGLLHTGGGPVLDPTTGAQVGSYGRSGALAIDAAQDRAFLLAGSTLASYSTITQLSDQTRWVPDVFSLTSSMVDAGDALAVRDSDRIQLLGPGVTSDGFDAPPTPTSVVRVEDAVTTTQSVRALRAAPSDDVVYATVPQAAASYPNELVELDPVTGTVGRHLVVGGDPGALDVSSDGSTIVVGHALASRVTEVDVETFTVRRTVNLVDGNGGAAFARDVAVFSGDADAYAVALRGTGTSPSNGGVVAVVGGVVLPDRVPGRNGPSNVVATGAPAVVWGHNGDNSASGFFRMDLTPTGLDVEQIASHVVHGNPVLEGLGGLVYASDGVVVNPELGSAVGRYEASGVPVPVPALGRALLLDDRELIESDLDQLWSVRTVFRALPADATSAVLAGTRLVVATAGGQLVSIPLGADPLSAPRDLTAEGVEGGVSLGWDPPLDDGGNPVLSYRIFRDDVLLTETATQSPRTFVDETAEPGTTHQYEVSAVTTDGEGPRSAPATGEALPVYGFSDVLPGHPFFDDIRWMAVNGISTGYEDGTYRPSAPVTRQSMAAFLHRLAGAPALDPPDVASYRDVSASHPFFAEVEWLTEVGVAGGFHDGTFRPSAVVSRQAMSAFLYRMAGSPPFVEPAAARYPDVGTGHLFFAEIEWMAAEQITTVALGDPFSPGAAVTRQAMSAFLHRLAEGPGIHV